MKTCSAFAPTRWSALALAAGVAWGVSAAPARAADAGQAYVSNQAGDISVIDIATLEVTGRIDAYGKSPRGIGVTADGKLLVTANRDDGNISVIDRASGKLLRHIKIGSNPEFVRVRGHFAFVSFEPSSEGKPAPKGAAPASAPPPDGPPASGGGKDDDDNKQPARIAIVDLQQGKVVRDIEGGIETEGIEFAADGKHILITNESANTVTIHRIADGKKVKTVDLAKYGERPRGIKRAPDGQTYIATIEHGNAFVVLDAKYDVVKSVPTGEYPYGVAFDAAGQRLFIAEAKSKALQVFDATSHSAIKSIPVGERCWHFSFTPDNHQILIACGRSNEVVAIDARTLEPVKRIADAKQPWGVVVYPKAPGSLDAPE